MVCTTRYDRAELARVVHCVTFEDVGKKLGNNWVLRHLNLSLPTGQITAIVGTSGSGKTTLLQLVNGLHRVSEGRIQVMGESIPNAALEHFRRGIGYAVQGAALFPHMSIYNNTTIIAKLAGWKQPDIEHRFEYLFGISDLSLDLASRYPHELSGGQQHRVGLCRAMMLNPDVLLLDEPFSAIDPITRREIHQHFLQLQDQMRFSTLLVTHDVDEAKRLSDYLVVLDAGRIIQEGATDQVFTQPADDYVRTLLDSSA